MAIVKLILCLTVNNLKKQQLHVQGSESTWCTFCQLLIREGTYIFANFDPGLRSVVKVLFELICQRNKIFCSLMALFRTLVPRCLCFFEKCSSFMLVLCWQSMISQAERESQVRKTSQEMGRRQSTHTYNQPESTGTSTISRTTQLNGMRAIL